MLSMDVRRFLNEREFTVAWSGGKDSTACLLWVLDNVGHDDWDILYVEVTGNTHPLCTRYVMDVVKRLGVRSKLRVVRREDLDFFDALRRWGVPVLGKYRWCFYQFKLKLFKRFGRLTQVSGMRRGDSWRRRKVKPIEWFRMVGGVVVSPILGWGREDVFRVMREHGVEPNPCYSLYGHSGNCMFCPYHDRVAIAKTLRDPEWGGKIISVLRGLGPKGSISREVRRKWLKLSSNIPLTAYGAIE